MDKDKEKIANLTAEEVKAEREYKDKTKQLDQQIAQIQQSTKASMPFLQRYHERMRMKYNWYYQWHLWPYSRVAHVLFLGIYFLVLTLFGFHFFKAPKVVMAAGNSCVSNVVAGDWDNIGTWTGCGGVVPQVGDSVNILNGHTITMTAGGDITGGSIEIDEGGELVMTGFDSFVTTGFTNNGTLTADQNIISIAGDWANNGVFTAGASNLYFNGGGDQVISGSTTQDFYILTIEKASGEVILDIDVNLAGSGVQPFINFGGSTLNLQNHNLTFVNESDGMFISSGDGATIFDSSGGGKVIFLGNGAISTEAVGTLYFGNLELGDPVSSAPQVILQDTVGVGIIFAFDDVSIHNADALFDTWGLPIQVSGDWYNVGTFNVASIIFNGTTAATYTDINATTQDLNTATIAKTGPTVDDNKITLVSVSGNGLKAVDLDISANNTLDIAGNNLTISGNFVNNGTLKQTGSGATVSLTNDSAHGTVEYTATSGSRDIRAWDYYHLKINGSGGTFKLPANTTVNGNLDITAGIFNTRSTAGADKSLTIAGSVTVVGTLTANSSAISLGGDWNSLSGTISGPTAWGAGGYTITFTGGGTFNGDNNFNNITVQDNKTITLLTQMRVLGTLTLGSGTVVNASSAQYINLFGADTTYGNTSNPLVLDPLANIEDTDIIVSFGLGSSYTANIPGHTYGRLVFVGSTGSIANAQSDITSNSTVTIRRGGALDADLGVKLDMGTHNLLVKGSLEIGHLTDNRRNGRLYATSGTIEVWGNFLLYAANTATGNSNTFSPGSDTVIIKGNYTNYGTGAVLDAGTSTFDFQNTTSKTLNSGGTDTSHDFNNLTHSGAGTLQLLTNAIDINGIFTNSNGTFDASGLNVNVADDFLISGGSFSVGGTPGAQTVTFDGVNEATISGSTTFNNLVMNTTGIGAKTIKFPTGLANKQTINSTWTLDGDSGKVLTLASVTPATAWEFVIPADINPSGNFISVQDSQNNTNGFRITPGADVTNLGNNDPGWNFNQAPDDPTNLVQKKTNDTVITAGGWTNESSVKYTATVTDPDANQVKLCVEIKPTGTGFTNIKDDANCSALVASGSTAEVTIPGQVNNTQYHWQAYAEDSNAVDSNWVDYGTDPAYGIYLTTEYVLTATSPQATSVGWSETVTAKDSGGATVTTANNTIDMTSSSGTVKFYTAGDYLTETTSYTLSSGVATVYIKNNNVATEDITYTATDSHSVTGTSAAISVVHTLPSSTIITPTAGQTLPPGTVATAGTASAATNLTVSQVEVTVNGVDWYVATGTTNWTYNFNLIATGDYTVQSRATDNLGAVETPGAGVLIHIVNTSPTSAITTPADGTTVGVGTVQILGTSEDTFGGVVAKVEVRVNSGAWEESTNTGTNFSTWAYDASLTSAGDYIIQSRATDSFGAVEAPSAGVTIHVSTSLPTTQTTKPAQSEWVTTSSYDAIGVATAPTGTTISKVEVTLDGTNWVQATDTGTNFSTWKYVLTNLADDHYTLKSRATNSLGIVSSVYTVTFGVDTVAPTKPGNFSTFNVTNYLAGNERALLWWQASTDTVSGVKEYQIFRGAEQIATTTQNYYIDESPVSGIYQIKAVDNAGNLVISDESNLDMTNSNIVPFVISNVRAIPSKLLNSDGKTSVLISWQTDQPSTSLVYYGLGGAKANQAGIDNQLNTSHSIVITNLDPNITYHYSVASQDVYGVKQASSDQVFTTVSNLSTQTVWHRVIQNFQRSFEWAKKAMAEPVLEKLGLILSPGQISPQMIVYNVSVPNANVYQSFISYSDNDGFILERSTDGKNFARIASVTDRNYYFDQNLSSETIYYYQAKGNSNIVSVRTSGIDTNPPIISELATKELGQNKKQTEIVISYQTDKLATTEVSINDKVYQDNFLNQSHLVLIDNLKTGQDYNYTVKSDDIAGNSATANGDFRVKEKKTVKSVWQSVSGSLQIKYVQFADWMKK